MIHFTVDFGLGAGAGFVAGAFCPAIGRRIKALFVKDSYALKIDAAKVQAKLEVIQAKVIAAAESEAKKALASANKV